MLMARRHSKFEGRILNILQVRLDRLFQLGVVLGASQGRPEEKSFYIPFRSFSYNRLLLLLILLLGRLQVRAVRNCRKALTRDDDSSS